MSKNEWVKEQKDRWLKSISFLTATDLQDVKAVYNHLEQAGVIDKNKEEEFLKNAK